MGKYEARVTKTSYITRLVVAILISFVSGLLVGYFFGQKRPMNFQKQAAKSVIAQTETTKPIQSLKNSIPGKDEQTNLVKGTLKSFYDINLNTFKRLESESLKESEAKGISQDSIFKDKLINEYQGMLTKKQLETVTDFVNKGNLQSDYFLDYFSSQEGSIINIIKNIEYKANTISAKAVITNPFVYGGNYDIPSSQSFFGELKGKGITKLQYTKLLRLKPSKINMIETKDITLTIENINEKWMITLMNDVLDSSEIRDVTINGKSIAFVDLMKKYIK